MFPSPTPWHPPIRRALLYLCLTAATVLATALLPPPTSAAQYDGHLSLPDGHLGGATASLDATGRRVAGTLSIAAGASLASGDYAVNGRQRGVRLVVTGLSSAGTSLKWNGRLQKGLGAFVGVMHLKGPAGRLNARLALATRDPASTTCDDYFQTQVMMRVLLPVCATCHTGAGLAAGTRLQVIAADASSTRASVASVIDGVDPPASKLLQKPVGNLGHGGGAVLAGDAAEFLILQQWVNLVTTGQCGAIAPPPGGGDAGATLYTDNCASCHGTDGQGVGGRPTILCNRNVHDAVRSGRNAPGGQSLMPPFPRLTETDIGLVQAYLDAQCPADTATGAALFTGNCASCHGIDAGGGSGPDIHCARVIGDTVRNGVSGPFGLMPAQMRLTDPEITKIQDQLRSLCPLDAGATGAELFAGNCAGCHGASGAGDGTRRPDIRCSVPSRVANAVRKGRGAAFPVMPSWGLTSLSDAELTSVRAFVGAGCSGTPAALFASNCATCHGATGSGGQNANGLSGPNIRCKSSAAVLDAVVDGFGGMPALPDLTGPQTSAIVGFLGTGCN